MSDIDRIIEGLSEARRKLIMALPGDGSWGRAPSRPVAKRAFWAYHSLVDHRHCPPSPNEEWGLNERGQAVRARLMEMQAET